MTFAATAVSRRLALLQPCNLPDECFGFGFGFGFAVAFDVPGPLPQRRSRREKPEGRRAGMHAVFLRDMDVA